MTEKRKILILQAHNLGDAVISTALVETIAAGLPDAQIDVLTRPEISRIFACNPHVHEVYTGRFPMGSVHDFGVKEMLSLFSLIWRLRRQGYTDIVNLAGDFREEFLGKFISSGNNWSPAWAADHPCSKVIRRPAFKVANRPVTIPIDKPNIYDAAWIIGDAVSGSEGQKSALYTSQKEKMVWNPIDGVVGLHPMASQPWRRWKMEEWQALTRHLIEHEIDVYVFGAPAEREELQQYFGSLNARKIKIVTSSLSDYFAGVSRMQMLLCHDSFASHVACALGVPTILLNGANDARAWAPPGSTVLAAGPGMACYPCYNRPTCTGSAHEYGCVRHISPETVVNAVWRVLEANRTALRSII